MTSVEWDELLPNRKWTPRNAKCWSHLMPPPEAQLRHLLPGNFEGSCALHSYSEALTAMLRGLVNSNDIRVNLTNLIQICLANGVLTATGTSGENLKGFVNSGHAIQLQGSLPEHYVGNPANNVDNPLASISLMGSKLCQVKYKSLPFGTPTSAEAETAMNYRELLCSILDNHPVVICFPIQKHYQKRRDGGVPYRLLEGEQHYLKKNKTTLWHIGRYFGLVNDNSERIYHCVSAYAYDCSGGDVRTMRIHYQENGIGFPDEQPERHAIHPDAIESFFVPFVDEAYFCNTPV